MDRILMVKKLFELRGKNRRNENIKLIFEIGNNAVNYIKYLEKSGKLYHIIFGYNTPHPLKFSSASDRFGVTYFIQAQPHSVDKGINYSMYHGEHTLEIVVKPHEHLITCNIYENGQMVKELYINKESYNNLSKVINKNNVRQKFSYNIPSFIK